MDVLAVIAAVVVGGVFVVAGVTKLAGPSRWRADAEAMGAPRLVVPVLPYAEVVIGAALVAQVVRLVAGVAAAAALLGFTVAIVRQLRGGHRPVCACFGSLSRSAIGWTTVLRNLTLAALAVIAAIA